MDIFLNQLIQFYITLNNTKSQPLNSTHYAVLYPQNGDRIVTIDYVTSLHPMYTNRAMVLSMRRCQHVSRYLSDAYCWSSVSSAAASVPAGDVNDISD